MPRFSGILLLIIVATVGAIAFVSVRGGWQKQQRLHQAQLIARQCNYPTESVELDRSEMRGRDGLINLEEEVLDCETGRKKASLACLEAGLSDKAIPYLQVGRDGTCFEGDPPPPLI